MNAPTIQTVELPNGLTLTLTDRSKKIAGDRWLVSMAAHVAVPVVDDHRPEGVTLEDLIKTIGPSAVFEKKMERNFIADGEKDAVLNELAASFLKTNRAYLSHAAFPVRFLLKSYREKKIRQGHG